MQKQYLIQVFRSEDDVVGHWENTSFADGKSIEEVIKVVNDMVSYSHQPITRVRILEILGEMKVTRVIDTFSVPLDEDAFVWENFNVEIKREENEEPLVEIQWGWTAGWSEEKIKSLAEDMPTGYDSMTTSLYGAKKLVEKLTNFIKNEENR